MCVWPTGDNYCKSVCWFSSIKHRPITTVWIEKNSSWEAAYRLTQNTYIYKWEWGKPERSNSMGKDLVGMKTEAKKKAGIFGAVNQIDY